MLIHRLNVINSQVQVILCMIAGGGPEVGSPGLEKFASTEGNVLTNWEEITEIIMSLEEPTWEEIFK